MHDFFLSLWSNLDLIAAAVFLFFVRPRRFRRLLLADTYGLELRPSVENQSSPHVKEAREIAANPGRATIERDAFAGSP